MVHIEMKHCKNCGVLPPLGQLKSLKELHIIGMSGVKHVGREFYGQAITKPFPVLEVLRFKDMPEWEDWFAFGVDDEVRPFDNVTRLLIINCPKLVGKLPSNLPRLEKLEITECQKLVVEFEGLIYPSVTSLSVEGIELPLSPSMLSNMNNTHLSSCLSSLSLGTISVPDSLRGTSIFCQHLNSVTNLTFVNIRNLVCIPKWLAFNLTALNQLYIRSCEELETLLDNSNCKAMPLELQQQLPALKQLRIVSCPQFVSLLIEDEDMDGESQANQESKSVQSFMPRLESLSIYYCAKLDKLPRGLYKLPALQQLCIESCPQFVSLFIEDGESQANHESKAVQSFMPKLEPLIIKDCSKLDKLPRGLYMLTCLVKLEVSWCNNLVSLPEAGFPSTLKTLRFKSCDALESPLPCWNNHNNLEKVSVSHCSSLTSLFSSSCRGSMSTGGLPSSLKYLEINNCEKLETLVSREEMKIHCPSLETIEIYDCGRLKYLPDPHYGDSLGSLKELKLRGCEDLQGLSNGWLRAITYLRRIYIGGEMSSFSYILKASFLTNLTSLQLEDMTTNVHPSEWGLHRFSSLRFLQLFGPIRDQEGEVVKVSVFPLDGMLPTSLTTLKIEDFPDLERLSSKGFQCLSSLKHLVLFECPRLAYLPDGGFPDTLLSLSIIGSPLLKKKCEKGKGKYWPIISCIPDVDIWSV